MKNDRKQLLVPLAALALLFLFNLIADPSFFKLTFGYNSAGAPVLSGYLMTIIDNGSELAILAIGMTLVTAACGGQDISVGSVGTIAGSIFVITLCGDGDRVPVPDRHRHQRHKSGDINGPVIL